MKRVLVGVVCFVIAPVIGLISGGSMPNPPGNGPGTGQVLLGAAVPALLTAGIARLVRIRGVEAGLWTFASLAATGGLVLLLVWYVETYLPT